MQSIFYGGLDIPVFVQDSRERYVLVTKDGNHKRCDDNGANESGLDRSEWQRCAVCHSF
jgi:hypothetical protein